MMTRTCRQVPGQGPTPWVGRHRVLQLWCRAPCFPDSSESGVLCSRSHCLWATKHCAAAPAKVLHRAVVLCGGRHAGCGGADQDQQVLPGSLAAP